MFSFHTEIVCPICKNKADKVSAITVKSLVKEDYQKQLSSIEDFYFCKTSNCEVIYFKGNDLIKQQDFKIEVGLKDWSKNNTICYCFDWTKDKVLEQLKQEGKTNVVEDISSKMNDIGCSCDTKNPSGKCCLKEVKELVKELT